MKKIILVATGDELTWVPWNSDGLRLCRENPSIAGYGFAFLSGGGYAYVYDTDDRACTMKYYGSCNSKETVERKAVELGIIRIEETAEPQPGPTQEEYLIEEARAIILDAARNNFDRKRALRFIADSEGK